MLYNQETTKNIAEFLKALGNEYRLQIVNLLISGEKNVSQLNEHVKVSQPALSQHLSKLREVGIVDFRRDRRQIYYAISHPHAVSLLTVMATFSPQQRKQVAEAV